MAEIHTQTSSVSADCPPLATLCEYLTGRLLRTEFDGVEAHLAACPECLLGITSVELGEDSLLTQLRRLPSQSDLGEFELILRLGRGGMGEVYKARHRKLGRYFAVKVVHSDLRGDPHFVARFLREMESLGKIDSPHVVQAVAAGECDGTLFCALELIDGTDLGSLVSERGSLSCADAAEAIAQAVLGLTALHAADLVHRDLHPGNLLLDRKGRLKIADLGLVAVTNRSRGGQGLTRASDRIGSKAFVAPEQWRRPDIATPQADFFSLGCVWYFLLTARAPARDPISHEITNLEDSLAHVPARCRKLLRQLLANDPNQRPADHQSLVTQLRRLSKRGRLGNLLGHDEFTPNREKFGGRKVGIAVTGVLVTTLGVTWWWLQLFASDNSPYHPLAPEVIRERIVNQRGEVRFRRFYFEGVPREQVFELLNDADGMLPKRTLNTYWHLDATGHLSEPQAVNEYSAHPEFKIAIPPGTHKVTAQPARMVTNDETGELVADVRDHLIFIFYVYPDLAAQEIEVSPTKVHAGDEIQLSFQLHNRGTVPANPGVIRIFLNPQQPAYLTGVLLEQAYPAMPVGATERMSFRLRVPSNTPAGESFLSLWVDATETTHERDELEISTWEKAKNDGFHFLVYHDPKGKVPPNNRHAVKVTVLP